MIISINYFLHAAVDEPEIDIELLVGHLQNVAESLISENFGGT
jgi:hypothetical protein